MNIVEGQGWPDFLMLPKVDENEFYKNLDLRFKQRQIYTYIGEQVVSMNPFERLNNTSDETVAQYKKKYMYEVPPHVFALAEDTYTSLMTNRSDQCVIITGESGAGKTEASKIFMQYIAKVSGKGEKAESIKQSLLASNPVLESFGNAKTVRNDNSSRFGKYMEIQFDGAGAPQAGQISQYLLEKSRVVTRAKDERSFHIFYFLLSQKDMLPGLSLTADHANYHYLKLSGCYNVPHMNDAKEFQEVSSAMLNLGFEPDNQKSVWSFLSAILNIGNVQFSPDKSITSADASKIVNTDCLATVSKLLSVDVASMAKALTTRSITTGAGRANSSINVYLDVAQAEFSRDSLAKTLYDKIFDWVVTKINSRIQSDSNKKAEMVVGVLDIYGFEIFDNNSFEQFCINYCNEKLQQLFIELVLRSEQEEYVREGIEWTPIDFFNNVPICQLIEGKMGIFKTLDDTCMVGKATPMEFLDRLNSSQGKHDHYRSFVSSKDKSISPGAFRIKHYAGEVDYEVEGFLFKNQDTLWNSLREAMQGSSNPLMEVLFPAEKVRSKARPVTAGTSFKKNVNELIGKLAACQPHYIRCIKSNDEKRGFVMNEERVRHQCRYLNLLETVRVRKAGFCARRPYARFLPRYKMLSKDTWPIWRGSDRDGVQKIFDELSIQPKEYAMGNTKVFVKDAMTLFAIEKKRLELLPIVAIQLQKTFRGWSARKWVREHQAMLSQKKKAGTIQAAYVRYKERQYFKDLAAAWASAKGNEFGKHLVIAQPKPAFAKVKPFLLRMHIAWWAHLKVTSLTPEQQGRMRQKVQALTLFKGKKPWNCQRAFNADYCNTDGNNHKAEYVLAVQDLFQKGGDSKILFSDTMAKVNRKAKAQLRALILTDMNIYKYEPKKYKIKKEAIPLAKVQSIHCSSQEDCYVIVKMEAPLRDLVMDFGTNGSEMCSEFVTVLYSQMQDMGKGVPVTFEDRIQFNNSRNPGKPGVDNTLTFEKNPSPKTGRLPGRSMARLSHMMMSLENAAAFKKKGDGSFCVYY